MLLFFDRHMVTPPSSPPPPPESATPSSSSSSKKTRKATQLRSLATRPIEVKRTVVHVDPVTRKVDGHRKKLKTYLGIVICDKMDVTYDNCKQVSITQKDLI